MSEPVRYTWLTGFHCVRCDRDGKDGEHHLHGYGRCPRRWAARIYDDGKDISNDGLFAP